MKIHNPYNAILIQREHVPLGKLKLDFEHKSTVDRIRPGLWHQHNKDGFIPVGHDEKHTLIYGSDGGVLAYHVPAVHLHNHGVNTDLAGVIEGIEVKGNTKHGGVYRSEAITRHYLTWCGRGGKEPFRSAEYKKDGATA
jgi:hypothetical protein